MFQFLGTFTKAQFDLFNNWVMSQVVDIDARIANLTEQTKRVGCVRMQFDGEGYPTRYRVTPNNSLMAKLVQAYEVRGGNLCRDFTIRMWDQPVSMAEGDPRGGSTQTTGGQVFRSAQMNDTWTAVIITAIRKPFIESLKGKRETLEYRIKRVQDLYQELNLEVALLRVTQMEPAGLEAESGINTGLTPSQQEIGLTSGEADLGAAFERLIKSPKLSLPVLIRKIQLAMTDPASFRSIQDTTAYDIFGLKIQPLRGFGTEVSNLGGTS
jgi:hypothetical protein